MFLFPALRTTRQATQQQKPLRRHRLLLEMMSRIIPVILKIANQTGALPHSVKPSLEHTW
jgi:hypothetical protein